MIKPKNNICDLKKRYTAAASVIMFNTVDFINQVKIALFAKYHGDVIPFLNIILWVRPDLAKYFTNFQFFSNFI